MLISVRLCVIGGALDIERNERCHRKVETNCKLFLTRKPSDLIELIFNMMESQALMKLTKQ